MPGEAERAQIWRVQLHPSRTTSISRHWRAATR
jgi:hypothetical protein